MRNLILVLVLWSLSACAVVEEIPVVVVEPPAVVAAIPVIEVPQTPDVVESAPIVKTNNLSVLGLLMAVLFVVVGLFIVLCFLHKWMEKREKQLVQ